VTSYSRQNEKDLKLPVMETYSFTEIFGNNWWNKIYISPMLFLAGTKKPVSARSTRISGRLWISLHEKIL
jgi:hypothetical protein